MRIKGKYHSLTTEYFSIVAKKHHVDCWNNPHFEYFSNMTTAGREAEEMLGEW